MSSWEGQVDLPGSAATRGWVNVSGISRGLLGSPTDSDWFHVYLTAGVQYRLGAYGSGLDLALGLHSLSGALIASADSSRADAAETLFFTPTTSGVYYAAIQASPLASANASTGAYYLSLTSNKPDDVPGTLFSNSTLSLGGSRSGALEQAFDADFHAITLTQGKTYRFQLSGERADSRLFVFDGNGAPLDISAEGSLSFTPSQSGKYFIEVSGKFADITGTYVLTATEQGAAAALPTLTVGSRSMVDGAAGGVSTMNFTLRLSQPSTQAVTLQFATVDGTAVAGVDYQAVNRSVTIPAGATAVDVPVLIYGNAVFEPARLFDVEISQLRGASYSGSAWGEIRDDDTPAGITLPTDLYAEWQWYLYDIGAHQAWTLATGRGVKIGLFDQGVDRSHPDLNRNTLAGVNAATLQPGGAPQRSADNHGTQVAGVVGAERDGGGLVGVAYDATLVPIYSSLSIGPALVTEITNAFRYALQLDVLNNSWGFGNLLFSGTNWAFLDDAKSPLFAPAFQALKNLADQGRQGLGTVVVQAAGNGFGVGDDSNLHNFQNSRYVITVGSTDYFGESSSFSTGGASVLVAAPGGSGAGGWDGLLTADRVGSAGANAGNFSWQEGTSFSAPIVSGIVALMLEANPRLGYRDVQQILAMTARQVDPAVDDWESNGATHWNGGGMHFNSLIHAQGFGLVDAPAAVRLAASWDQPALTSANALEVSASQSVQQKIPDDSDDPVLSQITISQAMVVERAEVTLNIQHSFIGDLSVLLMSPSGTTSVLMFRPAQGALGAFGSSQDDVHFTFSTVLNWGESSAGRWSLGVFDSARGDIGQLLDWSLTLIGRPESANDVYVYTNEYSDLVRQDPSRALLRDSDGGIETLNFAAMDQHSRVDLSGRSASHLGGTPFAVAPGVHLGTVIGGAGNDTLLAGASAVTLRGGYGNDSLLGGALSDTLAGGPGNDLLIGGGGFNSLDGGAGLDTAGFAGNRASFRVTRSSHAGEAHYQVSGASGQADTLIGIERLLFSDIGLALDLQGHAGEAARLIGTLFGPQRLADARLVGQWLAVLDQGASLSQALGQALHSTDYLRAAGSTSNRDFVTLVYTNVVGVAPGAAELAHFVGLLDRGEHTQTSLALLAAELDLTAQRVDLVGLGATGLEFLPG